MISGPATARAEVVEDQAAAARLVARAAPTGLTGLLTPRPANLRSGRQGNIVVAEAKSALIGFRQARTGVPVAQAEDLGLVPALAADQDPLGAGRVEAEPVAARIRPVAAQDHRAADQTADLAPQTAVPVRQTAATAAPAPQTVVRGAAVLHPRPIACTISPPANGPTLIPMAFPPGAARWSRST